MTESTCRFTSTSRPRLLNGRHRDDCTDDRCRGCQPCTDQHCVVCGIEHAARTCPGCLNETRAELNRVVWLTLRLLDERRHHPDDDIPGGDATVLAGPYSLGGAEQIIRHEGADRFGYPAWLGYGVDESLNLPGDPLPPLLVLATWEDDWRHMFGHGAAGWVAQVGPAAAYLLRHLSHAARWHEAFDDFAREIRHLRQRLEDVLAEGDRDEPGVACPRCAVELVRATDPRRPIRWCHGHGPLRVCAWPPVGCCDRGGLRDEWACPRCRRVFGHREYHNLVTATYRANAPAMTAPDIAEQYDVPRGSVRGWASVGKVRRRGHDLDGRVLYDVGDVCRRAGINPDAGQTGVRVS